MAPRISSLGRRSARSPPLRLSGFSGYYHYYLGSFAMSACEGMINLKSVLAGLKSDKK